MARRCGLQRTLDYPSTRPFTDGNSRMSAGDKSIQLQMRFLGFSYRHYRYRITSQHSGHFITVSVPQDNVTRPLTEQFITGRQQYYHTGQLSLAYSGLPVACYV